MISIPKKRDFILFAGLLILFSQACFTGKVSAQGEKKLTVIAGGDVMLGSWAQSILKQNGWNYPYLHLDSVLSKGNIVFANLEAPFGTGGTPFEKTYTFLVDPSLVNVLNAGHVNVVSLANNHIMDYGASALRETTAALDSHKIAHSGAGMDLSEARRPAILNINGQKVVIACYSLTFPEEFWATDTTAGSCFPSHTFFYRDLKKFKKENDLVIVSFHWGAELMETPKKYQVQLAHQAINAGADLVIGHHPHVVQGIEIYKGKIIAYSLGNYIFGSYSENARESYLLEVNFRNGRVAGCEIHPISIYNKIVDFQPRLLSGKHKQQFIQKLNNLSLELNQKPDVISSVGVIYTNLAN